MTRTDGGPAGTAVAPAPRPRPRRRTAVVLAGAGVSLLLALLAGVWVGALLPPGQVVLTLLDRAARLAGGHVGGGLDGTEAAVLLQLRLPRVLLAMLVGAALSLAGAAYQGVFRNPLADPYLLGAAAGAGLGATLVAAYAPDSGLAGDLLPISAFAGAGVAVLAAYILGRSAGAAAGPAALILAGVTIA